MKLPGITFAGTPPEPQALLSQITRHRGPRSPPPMIDADRLELLCRIPWVRPYSRTRVPDRFTFPIISPASMCIDLVESNETDAAAAKTTTRKPSFKGCPLHMPHTKEMWRSAGHSVVPQQLNKQPGTRDGCSPVCTNHARLRFRLGSSFRPHRGGARNNWLTSG